MAFVQVSKGRDAVAEIAGETSHLEFEGVYRATWPDVFRYAWLLLRQRQDAEDVAAEAYRRALEAWDAGRGPRGDALPWLFLIVRRIVIDKRRRHRLVAWLPLGSVPEPAGLAEEEAFRRSEVWLWFKASRCCCASSSTYPMPRQRRSSGRPSATSAPGSLVAWPRFEVGRRSWTDEREDRQRGSG